MDAYQSAAKALVEVMVEATGLDLSNLARSAKVAPSTLTRFMNSPVKHSLSLKTLVKLSLSSGVPIPADLLGVVPSRRLAVTGFQGSSPAVDSASGTEERSDVSRSDPPSQRDLAQDAQELLLLTIWNDIPPDRRDLCLLFLENMRDKSRSKISKRD